MIKIVFTPKVKKVFFVSFFIIIQTSIAFSQWELVIDKDSVKVYNKPNSDGYSFYLAEGFINASINDVYNTFTNIEEHPLWISNCAETRLIQETPDEEIIYMSLYDFPWPSSDRYSISHLKVVKKEDKHIHLKSSPAMDQDIILENAIYVTRFYEEVEIFYLAENRTKIKLSGAYDPAGSIPAWITDIFMKQSPYESILQMRVLLSKKETAQ